MDNAQTDKLVEELAKVIRSHHVTRRVIDKQRNQGKIFHQGDVEAARACLPVIQSLSAHPAGDVALLRQAFYAGWKANDDATDSFGFAPYPPTKCGEAYELFVCGLTDRNLATPAAPTTDASGEPVAWIRPNWNDPATFDGMSPVSTYYTNGWLPLYLEQPDAAAQSEARCTECGGTHPNWTSCDGPYVPTNGNPHEGKMMG